ncbi:unnamed protein product [Candida verbasci]|uniref:Uncharacterized protein n=1 Tax=Candida verbasci TaxID=1227364 RepID=A0A9W4XBW8_9ASCO|nr:unnamed protein product [Candida verbasci]
MLDKGYSQKLTNNVLNELNSRASHIQSQNFNSNDANIIKRRNKRYSGVHMSRFKNMDSISQHYSVLNNNIQNSRNSSTPSPQKQEFMGNGTSDIHEESASKRRRTINKNEEISLAKIMQDSKNPNVSGNDKSNFNSFSPIRKISPSKGSINLNSMLRQTTSTGSPNKEKQRSDKFIKPYPPSNKFRKSSLELAGVQSHQLQKKSSIPQLQRKSSIPQLQKKPSIPQLQKKPSIPQLQKKSSISQLNQQQQPQLRKKSSIPTFNKIAPNSSKLSTSKSLISKSPTTSSMNTINVNSKILQNTTNIPNQIPKSKSVTIPQPFSLYNKPTISSSQKSLNKFHKFKEKFS